MLSVFFNPQKLYFFDISGLGPMIRKARDKVLNEMTKKGLQRQERATSLCGQRAWWPIILINGDKGHDAYKAFLCFCGHHCLHD